MANSKISALTSATTPLAGTETLPIVQGGVTVKATVANITGGGGYAGSFTSLDYTTTLTGGTGIVNLGSGQFYKSATGIVGIGTTTVTSGSQLRVLNGSALNIELTNSATDATNKTGQVTISRYTNSQIQFTALRGSSTATTNSITIGGGSGAAAPATDVAIYTGALSAVAGTGTERMRVSAAGGVSIGTTADAGVGNLLMGTGNITQGTAAKGFNFTANTPVAGMTSQLLNWYEEGTWTPNQGAGLTLVGAFSSTGRYTRIGRQVSISGTVTGATSVAVTAAGVITNNLPFTVVTAGHGDATNVAINASATVICTGTSVTSAAAIAATATITFSATYFV